MRAYEFMSDFIAETASGGATGSGSVASVANPIGGVIRRMPSTPNLFGYIPAPKKKTKKKRKSSR